jgi:hypothetical protein
MLGAHALGAFQRIFSFFFRGKSANLFLEKKLYSAGALP